MSKYLFKLSFVSFLFCLATLHAQSSGVLKQNMIKEIKSRGPQKDTVESYDLTAHFKWHIVVRKKNGNILEFRDANPDTMNFDSGDLIVLNTQIKIDSSLLNRIYYIRYNFKGSGLIRINSETVVAEGYFDKNDDKKEHAEKHRGYKSIYFNNNSASIYMAFLPVLTKGNFNYAFTICTEAHRDKLLKEEQKSKLKGFFTGSFHFAFAVIFLIIFLFFKTGRENLFFSLYAISIALVYIFSDIEISPFFDTFTGISFIIGLECLAIFLAKVVLNQRRNPIFLILAIVFVTVTSILPDPETGNTNQLVAFVMVVALYVIFEIISLLYYIIQGFFQKRWEAKTIAYGFFAVFLLGIGLIIIAIIFSQTYDNDYIIFIEYMPSVALITILITMSIVLGRKNGENQVNLTAQLKEIKMLSQQNLDREIEKKQILENLNIELENKVVERTKEVIEQKEIIELKNNEITDNLNYAQRIQSAILPHIETIKETFKGFFVFYQPKDIVSGDFYSFIRKDDRVLLACADCTGHGVSGAFMSMIGSSLFTQVVKERNLSDPSEILTQLNEEVVSSLKQEYSDSHDGMDIALCNFDLQKGFLDYSGANRPLWLIRNGSLTEHKPDKYPIGGFQYSQNEKFTNHHIQISSGDTIYLSTDGFADQFGGPYGKKIMSKQFKEILLSIQNLDMPAQQQHLQQFFVQWKGAYEQVDDVLVMGIRI